MNILIVRTEKIQGDTDTGDIDEVCMASAMVRMGHNADVAVLDRFGVSNTELIPVEDPGEVRYDADLLGDDAYVHDEEPVQTPDEFVSLYRLEGIRPFGFGLFFSLNDIAMNYDRIIFTDYASILPWMYARNRSYRDRVRLYQKAYSHELNKRYDGKCAFVEALFLRNDKLKNIKCYAASRKAEEFLNRKGLTNVFVAGAGIDTLFWDDTVSIDENSSNKSASLAAFDNTLAQVENLKTVSGIPDRKYFTYVYSGGLRSDYNTSFVLDVIERLIKGHDDTRVILIDSGNAFRSPAITEKIRTLSRYGRMIYVPDADRVVRMHIYRMADCLICPHLYEETGTVIKVAAYFDLPAVTSLNGGTDMLFTDCSDIVFCNETDLDSWVRAAERIYEDKDLRATVKVGLLDVREHLGWDETVKTILKNDK